jgi:hypothetical protein
MTERQAALPEREVYSAREVAAKLSMSIYQFRRHRKRLQAHGMPAPILSAQAMRFSKRAIDDWIRNPHRAKASAAADVTAREVARDRAALQQAYGRKKRVDG